MITYVIFIFIYICTISLISISDHKVVSTFTDYKYVKTEGFLFIFTSDILNKTFEFIKSNNIQLLTYNPTNTKIKSSDHLI